jgi:hypothetical protein
MLIPIRVSNSSNQAASYTTSLAALVEKSFSMKVATAMEMANMPRYNIDVL